jgi:hypothetical protein
MRPLGALFLTEKGAEEGEVDDIILIALEACRERLVGYRIPFPPGFRPIAQVSTLRKPVQRRWCVADAVMLPRPSAVVELKRDPPRDAYLGSGGT